MNKQRTSNMTEHEKQLAHEFGIKDILLPRHREAGLKLSETCRNLPFQDVAKP